MPFLSFVRRQSVNAIGFATERKKSTVTVPIRERLESQTATAVQSQEQTCSPSRLLSLPVEIQHMIYSYIFTAWSLAVLGADEEHQYDLDDTFTLKEVGGRLIAGPPGADLLLVCHAMTAVTQPLYGRGCTGTFVLGKVTGRLMRRTLPKYLTTHTALSRFYAAVHTIHATFALDTGKFGLNLRRLFPHVRHVDCTVYEGVYGPMVRFGRTMDGFLAGQYDRELSEWTRPVVNQFISSEKHAVETVHERQCPWDDPRAVVDVKLVGSIVKLTGVVVGFHYRWEGPRVTSVARVARHPDRLRYWEDTMGRRDPAVSLLTSGLPADVPPSLRWVKPRRR